MEEVPGFSRRSTGRSPSRSCSAARRGQLAIVNGTLAGAIGLGLRLWIAGLAIWAIGHALSVWAARRDPLFVDVARRHLKYPVWMRP
jgi:type IV secretory pathway TrbD component